MEEIGILEVGGFQIGQAQDMEAATGITVLLCDTCAPTGVDIRGGGPASRETPLLDPRAASTGIHALVLSGGSAFALDAAGGVMRYLEERDIGFDVGVTRVPLVCQSCVFDLAIGRKDVRPDAAMAYQACLNARRDTVEEGCVGAGTGCTVGKCGGADFAMKSGLGTYAVRNGDLCVGAIVAVNAMGDIYDIDTGKQLAGLRGEDGTGLRSSEEFIYAMETQKAAGYAANTTIGAIVTNAAFDKSKMGKIAAMAHNGFARTIRPVHTSNDGDSIYALSLGTVEANIDVVGTLASYVMGKAVGRAVRAAHGMCGFPAMSDLGLL